MDDDTSDAVDDQENNDEDNDDAVNINSSMEGDYDDADTTTSVSSKTTTKQQQQRSVIYIGSFTDVPYISLSCTQVSCPHEWGRYRTTYNLYNHYWLEIFYGSR
jgi:hypothetical protein